MEARSFSRAFKLDVIRRMEAGESVSALSREVEVKREVLYRWRDAFGLSDEGGSGVSTWDWRGPLSGTQNLNLGGFDSRRCPVENAAIPEIVVDHAAR